MQILIVIFFHYIQFSPPETKIFKENARRFSKVLSVAQEENLKFGILQASILPVSVKIGHLI